MSRWCDPEVLRIWRLPGWNRRSLGQVVRDVKRQEAQKRNAKGERPE